MYPTTGREQHKHEEKQKEKKEHKRKGEEAKDRPSVRSSPVRLRRFGGFAVQACLLSCCPSENKIKFKIKLLSLSPSILSPPAQAEPSSQSQPPIPIIPSARHPAASINVNHAAPEGTRPLAGQATL
ncbi:hypothetical protein CVT26_015552 [Gymnopilus dilepis]|uniref:Uncharacterized protein n=1 Tax=Gymnopilus dilepis TaxID=231916 RepID=A0A409WSC9_9AGAR|nr:hypothetical protein CVT26_015552 [Gymnopilus dilepis]